MSKKYNWFVWLTAFLLLSALTVIGEDESKSVDRVINPAVAHSMYYAIPNENNFIISDEPQNTETLGKSSSKGIGPGMVIGTTWYDYQHNGSMGRMIDWTYDITNGLDIHFSWMYLPAPVVANRKMGYNSYRSSVGSLLGTVLLGDYAGYVNIDVTNDGRAIVGGHNSGVDYVDKFFFQNSPGSSSFDTSIAVPAALPNYQQTLWPKFRYIEGANDTVLHVLAKIPAVDNGDPSAIYYFRRVGGKELGTWDDPPKIVDTNYNIAYDLDANYDGKVALVWPANLPCDASALDTASGDDNTCENYYRSVQWDNDIYYQISLDNGATWQPRVNVTHYITTEDMVDSYRAYNNLSPLLDSDGNLHIVWDGSFWPADAYSTGHHGYFSGKFFHWSENNPVITVAHDFDWSQTNCNGGAWQLNATKMSISECNGRLYLLFVQFNDIPGGVTDDCASFSNPGFPTGAANGDLWITLSNDNGSTWATAVNITNTYTPGCDGSSIPCASEVWPSMSRFGSNHTGNFTDVEVIKPYGYTDDYYLDVQYIDDPIPGGVIMNEGTWAQADVKWFRLACAENFNVEPPTGACCDQAGICTIIDQATCEGAGNTYQGDGTTCTPNPCTCCNHDGIRGDVTGVPGIFVDDLTLLVNYLFKQGPEPDCYEEGDANGSGQIFVDDLTLLVNYLFKQGPPPADCPQ
ncbi:MAG: sialidase family protein [bacterium]